MVVRKTGASAAGLPRLTFVLGGARSGKSRFAEALAADSGRPVLYVATMVVGDDELRQRVQEHRRRRPAAWRTLEVARNIAQAVRSVRGADELVLLEDLAQVASTLLMDVGDAAAGHAAFAAADEALRQEIEALCALVGPAIVVSNEVGAGVVPAYPLGRAFRDALGLANQRVAARADRVYLMAAGIPILIKGG